MPVNRIILWFRYTKLLWQLIWPVIKCSEDDVPYRYYTAIVLPLLWIGAVMITMQLGANKQVVDPANTQINIKVRDGALQADDQIGNEQGFDREAKKVEWQCEDTPCDDKVNRVGNGMHEYIDLLR